MTQNINFIAIQSKLTDTSILEKYKLLLQATDAGQRTRIRREKLEPAIRDYFNRVQSSFNFKEGKGSESDLVSQKIVGFNIDIKAKESLEVGSGVKIGGKSIQISEIASQIDAVRAILSTSSIGTMSDILEKELVDDSLTKNRLTKFLEKRNLPYEVRDDPRSNLPGAFNIYQKTDSGKAKRIDSKKLERNIINLMEYELGEVPELDERNTLSSIGLLSEEMITYITKREVVKKVKADPTIAKIVELFKSMKTDGMIKYLQEKQQDAYNALKAKSQNVLVMYPNDKNNPTGLFISQISFTGNNWFNSSNFYMKVKNETGSSITFYPYLRIGIERKLITNLSASQFKAVETQLVADLKTLEGEVEKLGGNIVSVNVGKGKTIQGAVFNLNGEIISNVVGKENLPPGSIPQGSVRANIPRRKSSAFTSRTMAARQTLAQTRVKTPSIGSFISNDTITALTKREMMRRMPIGPVGGRPLSPKVLTYRTGRFVQSLKVIADMRTQSIQYYYNPLYWVHETTSRNPRNLIGSSINSVTRSLFGKRFNLIKAEQNIQ